MLEQFLGSRGRLQCLHNPSMHTWLLLYFPSKTHLALLKTSNAVNSRQHLIFIHAIVKSIFADLAKVSRWICLSAAWQKHNTQSSFYSVTYSIFSYMIKLTHKYYTFNARKPWFIQPVEYFFVHFLMLLGTQSFHYRIWNNENHCIYLTCTINRAGSFHGFLYYAVQGCRRNFVQSTKDL